MVGYMISGINDNVRVMVKCFNLVVIIFIIYNKWISKI